ncbi:MAG TPA: hypothetical protein VFF13_03965 [archaeon]|nr:hypothetical protein [archaeon]
MLQIETNFIPFRMKLARREPVMLKVTLKNMNETEELVSYDLVLARALSLDKGGFKSKETVRIGNMTPGQKHEQYFQIFPRPIVQEGEYPLKVKATEHYQSFNMVKKEYTKQFELKIDEK